MPLADAASGGGAGAGAGAGGGGSAFDALATLCCGCAGAGILALPYALKLVGVVPGVCMLAVVGAANVGTLRMLAVLTDDHRAALRNRQFSYETLVHVHLGPRAGAASHPFVVWLPAPAPSHAAAPPRCGVRGRAARTQQGHTYQAGGLRCVRRLRCTNRPRA